MDELVSIIIPAYNAERWIGDTIRSALSQTWAKIEVIIVDDGSIDRTLSIARSFEAKHIKVLTQQNQGVSAARNNGLKHAQGDYLQWLDADDLLAPDKITSQLKNAERGRGSRTLLTSSFGTFYYCHSRAEMRPTGLWQDLSPVDWLVVKFEEEAWMNPAPWLVSRNLSDVAGPWNESLVRDNDGEYICRVVAASQKVQFVSEGMSYYRLGNMSSLSASASGRAAESLTLSRSLCIQYLLALEKNERTTKACINFLQSLMPSLYPEKKALLCKVNALACELGGHLVPPEMGRRYYPVKVIFGRNAAKRAKGIDQYLRLILVKAYDNLLYRFGLLFRQKALP